MNNKTKNRNFKKLTKKQIFQIKKTCIKSHIPLYIELKYGNENGNQYIPNASNGLSIWIQGIAVKWGIETEEEAEKIFNIVLDYINNEAGFKNFDQEVFNEI
jgi:hypothetical protein